MSFRKWTTNEIAVLRQMVAAGKPYREVGAVIGRTETAIQCKATQLGINPMPGRERKGKETLCWKCENATNSGCYWSRYLRPVTGWRARYAPVKVGDRRLADSFIVIDCPEFVEG